MRDPELNNLLGDLLRRKNSEQPLSMNFAFVPRGNDDGKLILAKTGAVPKEKVKEAKTELKSNDNTIKGHCQARGELLVFVVTSGSTSDSLAQHLKHVIHHDTGRSLEVKVEKHGETADDEAAAPAIGELQNRLKTLMPDVQENSTHPIAGAKIRSLAAEIGHHLEHHEADLAAGKLATLELLLGKAAPAPVHDAGPSHAAPATDRERMQKHYDDGVRLWDVATQGLEKAVTALVHALAGADEPVATELIHGIGRVCRELPVLAPYLHDVARAAQHGQEDDIQAAQKAARQAHQACLAYLDDPLVQLVGDNPFATVDVKLLLHKPLELLQKTCPELK
jgi:hypothetical protein